MVPAVKKTAEWASRIGEFLKTNPRIAKTAVAFAAIATAVASIVTGVNEQNKELMTTLNAAVAKANAILAALEAKAILAAS